MTYQRESPLKDRGNLVWSLLAIIHAVVRSLTAHYHQTRMASWNILLFLAISVVRAFVDCHARDLHTLRAVSDFVLIPTIPQGASWKHLTVGEVHTEMVWPWTLGTDSPLDWSQTRVVLYFHGGGGVLCSSVTHRLITHAISVSSGAVVFVPNYRRIPEVSITDAVEDCVAVYRHLVEDLSIPATNISVMGDSAGGALTVLTVTHIRDTGIPLPACTVLLSPWCNFADRSPVCERENTDYINHRVLGFMSELVCRDSAGFCSKTNPSLASLRSFPPTLIQYGGAEYLGSQIRLFHKKCTAEDVDCTIVEYHEMVHIPHFFSPVSAIGRKAVTDLARFVTSKIKLNTQACEY